MVAVSLFSFIAVAGNFIGQVPNTGSKSHKLELSKNDGRKVIINGHEVAEGMTFLEMLNAIGEGPSHITFSKNSFYAHYRTDLGGLTFLFSKNGRIEIILFYRFY